MGRMRLYSIWIRAAFQRVILAEPEVLDQEHDVFEAAVI